MQIDEQILVFRLNFLALQACWPGHHASCGVLRDLQIILQENPKVQIEFVFYENCITLIMVFQVIRPQARA